MFCISLLSFSASTVALSAAPLMSSSFLYASDVFEQQLGLHCSGAEMYSRSSCRRMSKSEFLFLLLWKKCKDLKFSVRFLMILFNEFTFFVKHQSGVGVEWSEEKFLAELPVLRGQASEELAAFICLQTHQQCPQSHIPALDDFFFDKLEGERISTFRPRRILISYYLTSASLYNEENKLQ